MRAVKNGQPLAAFLSWGKYMRLRVTLKESELSQCLESSVGDIGKAPKRKMQLASLKKIKRKKAAKRSQYSQSVSVSGAIAVAVPDSHGSSSSSSAAVGALSPALSRKASVA